MASKRNQRKTTKSGSRRTDAIQAASDFGIDVSMLSDNLKRTPAERIKRHQAALNTVLKLRKASRI